MLYLSQEFMPKVARGFIYLFIYLFYVYEIEFWIEILFALDFSSLLIV